MSATGRADLSQRNCSKWKTWTDAKPAKDWCSCKSMQKLTERCLPHLHPTATLISGMPCFANCKMQSAHASRILRYAGAAETCARTPGFRPLVTTPPPGARTNPYARATSAKSTLMCPSGGWRCHLPNEHATTRAGGGGPRPAPGAGSEPPAPGSDPPATDAGREPPAPGSEPQAPLADLGLDLGCSSGSGGGGAALLWPTGSGAGGAGGGHFGGGGGGVSVTAGGGPGGGGGGLPKSPGRGDDGLAGVLDLDAGAMLDEDLVDATAPLDV